MFTGIVEELGEVLGRRHSNESALLYIRGRKIIEDLKVGDSVSVNGVCLTAAKITHEAFYADVMPETMRKSNLEELKVGDKVNLERALLAGGRLGGHFVSGHIDGTGTLLWERKEGNALLKSFSGPQDVLRYTVVKGSIAVDGVSLTVVDVDETSFQVSLIPHTLKETTLYYRKRGDKVNLEADLLGKYLEKFLAPFLQKNGLQPLSPQGGRLGGNEEFRRQDQSQSRAGSQGVTVSFLAENGFI